MKSLVAAAFAGGILIVLATCTPASSGGSRPASGSSADRSALSIPAADLTRVVQGTCQACHNDALLTGNLSLVGYDVATAAERAEITERMIRKLRAGMMPPPGMPRPGGDTLVALVETLERIMDRSAGSRQSPGTRPFQRLNRAEYERLIEDALGLRVDAAEWLPADQISASFDNIADVQAISPTLMDTYLNAASEIARRAVGQGNATASATTYSTPPHVSQHEWEAVEGAPFGTRGGISVLHAFPADGQYGFSMGFISGWGQRYHDVDVSIDGERVALLRYGGDIDFQGRKKFPVQTDRVFVRAGQHRLTAAFVRQTDGPYEDLLRPHDWSLTGTEVSYGTTALPHLTQLTVEGPYDATGVSDTPTRQRIFICRPTSSAEASRVFKRLFCRASKGSFKVPRTSSL